MNLTAKRSSRNDDSLVKIAEILGLLEEKGKTKYWLLEEVKKHNKILKVSPTVNSFEILQSCSKKTINQINKYLKDDEFAIQEIQTYTKTLHWFFTDIVGSSNPDMSTKTQARKINLLHMQIKKTETFKKLDLDSTVVLPTGDGVALGFSESPEQPLRLAIDLTKLLNKYNKIQREEDKVSIRIGIESGPVYFVKDLLDKDTVWGPGIIMARRVMDLCGTNQIFISQKIGEDISNSPTVHSSFVRISADATNVVLSWDEGSPNNIFMSASDDNGATFGTAINLSSANPGFSTTDLNIISDEIFVVWQDDSFPPNDILFRKATISPISLTLDSSQYKLFDTAIVTVTASGFDLTGQPDTINTSVISTSDLTGISLNLTETGNNSGIFTGNFQFDPINPSSGNILKATAGDTITVTFNGVSSPSSSIFPSIIEFLDSGGAITSQYTDGLTAHLKITDENSNLDIGAIDSISLNVNSIADPLGITLVLQETGLNTGIFGGVSQTTLAFMTSNFLPGIPSTLVITEDNTGVNNDPNLAETILSNIHSTTDVVGINIPLIETGINTGIFSGSISIRNAPSVPGQTLLVSPGDFIKQTGNNTIVNYGLVIPNQNAANGILLVDVSVAKDTITVTHLNISKSIQVDNQINPGGGTGGLVRPGLVFDAIGGLGGGSSKSKAPSLAPFQYRFLLPDLLKSLLDEKRDPDEIIEPIIIENSDSDNTVTISDMPLVINNNGYTIIGISNKIAPNVLQTNEIQNLALTVYETGMVEHVGLYTNLQEKDSEKNNSDTYILYYNNQPLEIIDPHGYFSEVTVEVKKVDSIRHIINYDIKFAKEMEKSNIVFNFWNDKRNAASTIIYDAWEVIPQEVADTTEGNQIDSFMSQDDSVQEIDNLHHEPKPSVPVWVKSNAEWWSEGQILDSEFVKSIQYLLEEKIILIPDSQIYENSGKPTTESSLDDVVIPNWIKNTAKWWADDSITEKDFVKSIEWLIQNNVIKV